MMNDFTTSEYAKINSLRRAIETRRPDLTGKLSDALILRLRGLAVSDLPEDRKKFTEILKREAVAVSTAAPKKAEIRFMLFKASGKWQYGGSAKVGKDFLTSFDVDERLRLLAKNQNDVVEGAITDRFYHCVYWSDVSLVVPSMIPASE